MNEVKFFRIERKNELIKAILLLFGRYLGLSHSSEFTCIILPVYKYLIAKVISSLVIFFRFAWTAKLNAFFVKAVAVCSRSAIKTFTASLATMDAPLFFINFLSGDHAKLPFSSHFYFPPQLWSVDHR